MNRSVMGTKSSRPVAQERFTECRFFSGSRKGEFPVTPVGEQAFLAGGRNEACGVRNTTINSYNINDYRDSNTCVCWNRKAWRQKIEAWLSENEKEDRAGEELQRKARQLHQANRRSFEDSGKSVYSYHFRIFG